eukprot:jgi/Hompol1/6108/HPOL_002225-RA
MPPPGTVPPTTQVPVQIDIPRVAGRRRFIKPLANGPMSHRFVEPTKRINDDESMRQWVQSEAYLRLLDFIQSLNESVRNKKVSDDCEVSMACVGIVEMLNVLDSWIDDIPPEPTPQRFGNISFRKWVARLKQEAEALSESILPAHLSQAKIELAGYLAGGFGDGTRIDYGSGHELAFVAWLCSLELLDVVGPNDYQALVTRVFVRYLELVRRLQKVYVLEPAGSHGVWGLDDHQFLPYFWGSAQLLDHQRIKPKSIMQPDIVAHFSKDYLYLACIQHIHEVKRGPFHEHSPMLYDISGVPTWSKVNSGMLKMYLAEVLHKLPVVQHFLFGSILPFSLALEVNPHESS